MKYIVFSLLVLSCYFTIACTCVGEGKFSDQFKQSDAVFSGRVIRIDTVFYADTLAIISAVAGEYRIHNYSRIKAIIEVKAWYKEKNARCEFVSVFTESQSSMCMFSFELDKDYIVYCKYLDNVFNGEPKRKKFFYTDKCTRTQLSSKKELDLLNDCLAK